MQPNLVVRNTFIDAVGEDEEDDDGPLDRSQSDPTGGRTKMVTPLKMFSPAQPIQEAEERAEDEPGDAAKPAPDKAADCALAEIQEDDEDGEDDDDDSDDGPLERTGGGGGYAVQTSAAAGAGRGSATGQKLGLTSLLPEDQTNLEGAAGAGGYAAGMAGMMWPPYMMFDPSMMYGMQPAMGNGGDDGQQASASSSWRMPPLGTGPPLGFVHNFHQETRNMGAVSPDFRHFTKVGYEGRLSVVSESKVHSDGVQRYLVQFAGGELSRADGVGFVFSSRLPCAKNIQRIVSIFVNQRGRICMRVFADIIRASAFIKTLEVGDWVELCIDLENKVATFNVWANTVTGWPALTGTPVSTAEFPYGNKLLKHNQGGNKQVNLSTGHLACVVKNVGVTIVLGS